MEAPIRSAQRLFRKVQEVDVTRLLPHPRNPNKGDVTAIVSSLEENGIFRPLVVQKSTMHVLIGNHTLEALKRVKATSAPVLYVDVDDAHALRILLADNKTARSSIWDDAQLLAILEELESPKGTGFSQDEFMSLLAAAEELKHLAEEDEAKPNGKAESSSSTSGEQYDIDYEDTDDDVDEDTDDDVEPEQPALTGPSSLKMGEIAFYLPADDLKRLKTRLGVVRKTNKLRNLSDALMFVLDAFERGQQSHV